MIQIKFCHNVGLGAVRKFIFQPTNQLVLYVEISVAAGYQTEQSRKETITVDVSCSTNALFPYFVVVVL